MAEEARQALVRRMKALVEDEGAGFDIESHRNAPAGLRIWCGCTVETADIEALTPWLELQPLAAQPAVSFRFKLEQGSPVRAVVQLADGSWVAGGTFVDSSGGGCTVSGATRKDGSWSQTLGQVSGRIFGCWPTNPSARTPCFPSTSPRRLPAG